MRWLVLSVPQYGGGTRSLWLRPDRVVGFFASKPDSDSTVRCEVIMSGHSGPIGITETVEEARLKWEEASQ